MHYVLLNADGSPAQFANDEIQGQAIPASAIPISDEDWAKWIAAPYAWVMVDGMLLETGKTPTPPLAASRRITYAEWLALFTENERAWGFASDNPKIREMISRATAENSVDLNSPAVAGFLDLCISLGSPLTAARKTEILAGQQPA